MDSEDFERFYELIRWGRVKSEGLESCVFDFVVISVFLFRLGFGGWGGYIID